MNGNSYINKYNACIHISFQKVKKKTLTGDFPSILAYLQLSFLFLHERRIFGLRLEKAKQTKTKCCQRLRKNASKSTRERLMRPIVRRQGFICWWQLKKQSQLLSWRPLVNKLRILRYRQENHSQMINTEQICWLNYLAIRNDFNKFCAVSVICSYVIFLYWVENFNCRKHVF